jgi:hypothetical protein
MRRWIILFSRCGTVLLAVGLALLLVSLIPAQIGAFTTVMTTLYPRTWTMGGYEGFLTPKLGLSLNVTANATLNIYVIEEPFQTIYNWIFDRYPNMTPFNVTYLEEFLKANPNSIGWQTAIDNGSIEYDYIPTKIINATLIFSNPSLNSTSVEGQVSGIEQVAPATKVRTLAQWTIPIGLLLTLPWLIDSAKKETKRHGSRLVNRSTQTTNS